MALLSSSQFSLLVVLFFTALSSAQKLQCNRARYSGSRTFSINEICINHAGCFCRETPSGPRVTCIDPLTSPDALNAHLLSRQVEFCHEYCSCSEDLKNETDSAKEDTDHVEESSINEYPVEKTQTVLHQNLPDPVEMSENPARKLEVRARPRFESCHNVVCNSQYHCEGLTFYKSCGPLLCLPWAEGMIGDPAASRRPRKIPGLMYCEPRG
jgi:hypothetical protein